MEGLQLPKVHRVKVALGDCYAIHYAVRADGSVPAREFMDALREKRWANDPDEPKLPADAQLGDYWHFLRACKHLADTGEPKRSGLVNALDEGVWEFKVSQKRMSWFDTDGEGGYTAKPLIRDRDASAHPQDEFWFFPDFDPLIRLGHCFPKAKHVRRTPQRDLDVSIAVRREDLDHDRR